MNRKKTVSKEEIKRTCDYWMLNALTGVVRFSENGFPMTMITEKMGNANQVLLMASSLGVINEEEFDAINHALSLTQTGLLCGRSKA